MKNRTKLILIVLFIFTSINATGQGMLIKGGTSFASFRNIKENGKHLLPFGYKKGLHLGIAYEEAISNNCFWEAGPMLHMKGSQENYPYKGKVSTVYIDVPILLKAHFELADDVFFYNVAGIYVGLGMFGSIHQGVTNKIEWSESLYGLKRFDFGFSLGAGFLFKHVQFGFGYDRGLLNINSDTVEDKDKTKNNVLKLSFGYRFVKQAKK